MRPLLVIAILLVPASARAGHGGTLSWAFDAHAHWLRAWPNVRSEPASSYLRELPSREHSIPGGATFGGVQAIYGAVLDDRWVLPILGVGVATTVGRYGAAPTSVDGSIAQLHPWTGRYWTLLLPGFGLRAKDRRWMGQLVVRPGVAWLSLDGEIAVGGETVEMNASTKGLFFLRAEVEACRRFDPESRLCTFIAPSIWEHRFLGGAQVGLRWEMGP
ncbi:MAG: hypothetical protein HYV09_35910 [Deltaproteobacteria bacterium]|nr:hypothetical protein [Deltaproteobacteria bacterium]